MVWMAYLCRHASRGRWPRPSRRCSMTRVSPRALRKQADGVSMRHSRRARRQAPCSRSTATSPYAPTENMIAHQHFQPRGHYIKQEPTISMLHSLALNRKISREQKTAIRKFLNPIAALAPTHKLETLAVIHGTDKLGHGYISQYAKYFGPIRNRKLNVLEIGVGGYQDPKAGANSLRMWQAHFPNSMIYALDI